MDTKGVNKTLLSTTFGEGTYYYKGLLFVQYVKVKTVLEEYYS